MAKTASEMIGVENCTDWWSQ